MPPSDRHHRPGTSPADDELGAALADLRDGPLDGDDGAEFRATLHRRLVQAGAPRPAGAWQRLQAWFAERPLAMGSASGVCAGIAAFWVMASVTAGPGSVSQTSQTSQTVAETHNPVRGPATGNGTEVACATPESAAQVARVRTQADVFVVPEGKVAMVQLHFAVADAVGEAEFGVLLPAGLAFFSDGEALAQRSFHWVAPLSAGDNAIPIAVVGRAPGQHRITATATIAGEVVVHEVVLDVRESV